MDVRYSRDPQSFVMMDSTEIRDEFLIPSLFEPGEIPLVYLHSDRTIVGSAVPTDEPLSLEAGDELRAEYFTERREVGVINVGGEGAITVDGEQYGMGNREMLYIGRGSRDITFTSNDAGHPALYYIVSLPAHREYPTTHIPQSQANRVELGAVETANERTLFQYIHEGGVQSCQLVMGFTQLAVGSVWNTMPGHTHERRSEVYMYFDLADNNVVFHMMGQPQETRHIVVRNGQAVASPSWSIHAGVGTSNYCFVWAMGGENQDFDDMDPFSYDDMM